MELALSLVFIGTLSVIIVVMINSTVQTYQRGMTLNKVNTTGMDLVDDMRSAVQNSASDSVAALCVDYYDEGSDGRKKCIEDNADSFVRVTKRGTVTIPKIDNRNEVKELTNVPVYGAFCTGSYSYIWNTGYYENDAESNANISGYEVNEVGRFVNVGPAELAYSLMYNDGRVETKTVSGFRLLKIRDNTRAVCVSAMRSVVRNGLGGDNWKKVYWTAEEVATNNGLIPKVFDISNSDDKEDRYPYVSEAEEPVEVLDRGTYNDLVLYDLYTAAPAISSTSDNMFYAVSFILGTVRGGIDITATGRNCTPPSEYETEDFDYCAINKFNFAAQASGSVIKR